jgi:uncharacterized damage-inducible protein DinB
MSNLSEQLAKHLRDVHFGGNWTVSSLQDQLKDVSWEQATQKVHSFNTIATLVFHINYFIAAVSEVLEGKPLEAHDKFSFEHPPIHSAEDWLRMKDKCWADAERFALLIALMPEAKIWGPFADEKYGTYYRNIQGIIEHTHYHLGQIALIKKLVMVS